MTAPTIAFYAPLKSPLHPNPSGDRKVARLFLEALRRAGLAPELASEFRSFLAEPDDAAFEAMAEAGAEEAERLIEDYTARPAAERPQLWFTYHVYYKAPDHIGPRVAAALGVPYVIAEASRSPRRLEDAWTGSAAYAEAAIDLADVVLYPTERDYPALAAQPLSTQRLILFPPFVDPGRKPGTKRRPEAPFRLLTVAMMRQGDKLASYAALADALRWLQSPRWTLEIIGDGPARGEVETLFEPFGDRVSLRGRIDDEDAMRAAYHGADLFVWPGVGEAFGMSYLEAKSLETPVVAEDRPGVRDVLRGGGARLTPLERPDQMAEAIGALLADPDALLALGRAGRVDVVANASLDARAEALWVLFDRLKLVDLSQTKRPTPATDLAAQDKASLH